MPFRPVVLLCLLLAPLATPPAAAAPTACAAHFVRGQAPDIGNPKLAAGVVELCFQAFAVGHSSQSRTPLWSAERLTRAGVNAARGLQRQNAFHVEPRLPEGDAAALADYRGSGYDRGHMSPSGDMPTPDAQQESFSLANMIPQAPMLNRNLWEEIESAVRDWAVGSGELYVVTGPLFQGQNLQALNGRVLVPTAVFKAVYSPSGRRAGVYLARNADDSSWREISVAQLIALGGIDVFPGLPAAVKAVAGALPPPAAHGGRRGTRAGQDLARASRTGGSDRTGWMELLRMLARELNR